MITLRQFCAIAILLTGVGLPLGCQKEAPYAVENQGCPKGRWEVSNSISNQYLRDYEYQMDHIFDLGPDTSFAPGDSIKILYVYEYLPDSSPSAGRSCRMFVDPNNFDYRPDLSDSLVMVKLDETEFFFYNASALNSPHLIFLSPRDESVALGVYMEIARARGGVDTVGDLSEATLILKSLKSLPDKYDPTNNIWYYMWRNAYQLPEGFDYGENRVKIKKGKPTDEEDPDNRDYQFIIGVNEGLYIQILGLDQYNTMGEKTPDSLVDDRQEIFRPDLGLLIFPHRTPYGSDTTYGSGPAAFPELNYKVPSIYYYVGLREKTHRSNYYLEFSLIVRPSEIELPCNNFKPSSETVYLNGHVLKRDTDYRVDYVEGILYLLMDEARDPDAKLEVEFGW